MSRRCAGLMEGGGGRIISSRGAFHFGFIEGRAVFLAIDIGRNIRLQS